tara:strand:- start:1066 stop:1995 length:930 start_codon:yes stop_codon:yes gene_type:complete
MRLYTIIVTYNSLKWIDRVIKSLEKSSTHTDIIVIDNGSKDGTLRLIEKKHPKIQLFKSEENLGFSKANNLGIEIAIKNNADFVFLLNHDAWVQDDTLYKLTKAAINHPEFGIFSPIHLNGKGDKLDENFSHYAGPKFCPNLMDDFYLGNNLKEIYESKFVNAAAWLISKNCSEKVGGFNPIFHIYGEDGNYVKRLHFMGYKLGIVPKSKIYHDRHKRPHHKVFIDEFLIYKKYIITTHSDPFNQVTFRWEYMAIIKDIIKQLVRLRPNKLKINFQKFFFLMKITKKIKSHRKISMESISPFLNFEKKA